MTTTTNLGLTLPTVGVDNNTWGTELNADLTALDALWATLGNNAFGTAAKYNTGTGGGTVPLLTGTGDLTLLGRALVGSHMAMISNDSVTTAFLLFDLNNGTEFGYNWTTGKLTYYVNGTAKFSVDANGNAVFAGTVTQNGTP